MNSQFSYDYIIAGAGCAGLSLAVRMIHSGKFTDKRILIIDKDDKTKNDRTWCFWEKEPGLFEPLIHHRWDKMWFHGDNYSKLLSLSPYQYKLVKGIDLYTYSLDLIRQQPNIDLLFEDVKRIHSDSDETFLLTEKNKYTASYIFNSIPFDKPDLKKNEYYLLQHFKGWVIETDASVFNPGEATLMDFRVGQQKGATFAYVMPFSGKKALVEYTLFSEELLNSSQYENGLRDYISNFLGINNYNIIEEENGIIPMTNHTFPVSDHHIINIGTAGGQTKASSGYTFRFIQKHSAAIVESLINNKRPVIKGVSKRFHFYDSVFLYILKEKKLPGKKIFTDLFKKNKPQQVLRFMDNESSLGEELKIISSLPSMPFLRAALKRV